MDNSEICRMSALDMSKAVRARKLSPVEVMDAVLSRIGQLNPGVNAFCTLAAENAREQAVKAEAAVARGDKLGPLHGVPVSIKDLIFTRGIRTTGGSEIFAGLVPQENDVVVERLEAAGAIVVGKTNSSEFGWAAITHNRLFGATRNPWNLELTPGGSSGGAAAAVASGMGPLAIGSDGGGSIRVPASLRRIRIQAFFWPCTQRARLSGLGDAGPHRAYYPYRKRRSSGNGDNCRTG